MGAITGTSIGVLAGLAAGSSHDKPKRISKFNWNSYSWFIIGEVVQGFIGGYFGDGGASYGAFTGIRFAYYSNYFNAVFLNNNAKYLGPIIGTFSRELLLVFFMGNIFTNYGYETRATGAIVGGLVGVIWWYIYNI